jgi:cytochrome c553
VPNDIYQEATMKYRGWILLSFMLIGFSAQADVAAGKQLHAQAKCLSCHAAQPYDREKTPTFDALVKRVAGCSQNFNTGWFDDEIRDVAEYLNREYYRFES